jgi:hypothetical protein
MENKTMISTPHYVVHYEDDFKRKHLTVAMNMSEVKFIRERFEVLFFEYIR